MQKLVKLIKLNNLQYNANRDPEFYRRVANEEFRLQALLGGSGTASCRFEVEGNTLCETSVALPGTFTCTFQFDTPGIRIGTLTVSSGSENFQQDIRLDVMEHAWVG
ncbi:MAG TPA: hypothetical protein VKA14_06005 [Gammaproteobacteria bacterium]|nr:hypothetical protein [Gammaproteobacteria bacterium]